MKPIFRSKLVLVPMCLLVLAIAFSVVMLTRGATPNPGHPWTDIGNGTWQSADAQTQLRTFIFPDSDAEVWTSSSTPRLLQQTVTVSTTLSASSSASIFADATTASINITLPSASGTNAGTVYFIKKIDASLQNQVTILTQPGQTVDGVSSINFVNRGESAMLQSDGTSWKAVMRRGYDYNTFHTLGTSTLNQTQWYTTVAAGTALTTAALTANKIYAMPLILTKITTIDQMGVDVTVASGSTMEVGIYNDNGNQFPGTLAVDAGSQSPGSLGAKTYTSNLPITLDAGLYWMVVNPSNAVTIRGFALAAVIPLLGYSSITATAKQAGWVSTQTAGALPATFPLTASATISASPFPTIFVHFSG